MRVDQMRIHRLSLPLLDHCQGLRANNSSLVCTVSAEMATPRWSSAAILAIATLALLFIGKHSTHVALQSQVVETLTHSEMLALLTAQT